MVDTTQVPASPPPSYRPASARPCKPGRSCIAGCCSAIFCHLTMTILFSGRKNSLVSSRVCATEVRQIPAHWTAATAPWPLDHSYAAWCRLAFASLDLTMMMTRTFSSKESFYYTHYSHFTLYAFIQETTASRRTVLPATKSPKRPNTTNLAHRALRRRERREAKSLSLPILHQPRGRPRPNPTRCISNDGCQRQWP